MNGREESGDDAFDVGRERRVLDVARGAAALSPESRDEWLDGECGGDEGLRARVEAVLGYMSDAPAPSEPPRIEPGAVFDGLELVRRIGEGAQGHVFEGRQVSLDRTVAVKFLKKDLWSTDEQLRRFRREGEATARLRHPNIVAVLGTGTWGEHPYLVQEFVAGGTLEDVLDARDDVSVEERDRWVADLCARLARGLQHAHSHDVVHRDLKPANVLVDTDGEPRITDFGLAKVLDAHDLSTPGMVVGTLNYMSPEQSVGEPIDARTDVYSLGCVMYRLLTGRVPFEASTVHALMRMISSTPPQLPSRVVPELSRDLEAVCLRCLEKDPEARYASAAELADDLERYLDGRPTRARPVGAATRVLRAAKRQSSATWGAVLALVALLAVTLDVFVTGPSAVVAAREGDDLGAFTVRLAVLVGLGVVAAWGGAVIARRAPRRPRLAAAGVVVAVAAAAGLGVANAVSQRVEAVFERERSALMTSIELTERRDTDDLDGFVERWGDRFGPVDHFVVASGYLERGRVGEAETWSMRLEALAERTPLSVALRAVVLDVRGRFVRAEELIAGLWALDDGRWSADEWRRVGALFARHPHLLGEADRAYERAAAAMVRLGGSDPTAQVELDIDHALVLDALCRDDDVEQKLARALAFPEHVKRNPGALRMQVSLACEQGDDEAVAEALAAVDEAGRKGIVPTVFVLARHHEALRATQGVERALEYVSAAADGGTNDAAVVEWAARQMYLAGRLDEADDYYARLDEIDPTSVAAAVGRGSCAYNRYVRIADEASAREDRSRLLSAYVRWTEEACDRDPDYFEAQYEAAAARFRMAQSTLDETSTRDDVVDVWKAFAEDLERALACNELSATTLNDLAYVRKEIARSERESPPREVAVLVERAIRLTEPPPASACPPPELLAELWDTKREVHEACGETAEALSAARANLALLPDGDPRRAACEGHVARLERLVTDR